MADSGIYVSMAGLKNSLMSQRIVANNLANANTPGFRADNFNVEALINASGEIRPEVYASPDNTLSDFTPGTPFPTGRDLDVALQGKGFFSVMKPNGEIGLTRDGHFNLSANGELVTSKGYLVLGSGGPISIPENQKVEIGKDGSISIRPLGKGVKGMVTLDRLKVVDPPLQTLVKQGDGTFQNQNGGDLPPMENPKCLSGNLESSNVNAIGEMVNLISQARSFEIQMKSLSEDKEKARIMAQLLQMS